VDPSISPSGSASCRLGSRMTVEYVGTGRPIVTGWSGSERRGDGRLGRAVAIEQDPAWPCPALNQGGGQASPPRAEWTERSTAMRTKLQMLG